MYRASVLPLSHVEANLKAQLSLLSKKPNFILLSHLHQLGLLKCAKLPVYDDRKSSSSQENFCSFFLPFGLDLLAQTETVISVIEACLGDLDLSVNEVGLLLLIRLMWPSALVPDECFLRLASALLIWICNEVRLSFVRHVVSHSFKTRTAV